MIKTIFLSTIFFFLSCNEKIVRQIPSSRGGFNIENIYVKCSSDNLKQLCPQLKKLDLQTSFKYECSSSGYEVIDCGCYEYLCSRPVSNYPTPSLETNYSTFDEDSTKDTKDPEISRDIPLGQILIDDSIEYTGEDFSGAIRSCSPISKDSICTTVFTKEDQYGLDCREKGYDIVKCGCHDPICI
jgi:hypothetical protein